MSNPLYDTLFGKYLGAQTSFLHLPDGGTLTHDAFLRMASRVAHALGEIGLAPGDRLAAQINKSAEALALYAACVQAGIVFLPLNTAYTPGELSYFVQNSGAKLLVCDGSSLQALTPVAHESGAAIETLNAFQVLKCWRKNLAFLVACWSCRCS